MKIFEIAIRNKAGVIPYYVNEAGTVYMLFMTPSNPAFGGTEYQIAKGKVDEGEDFQEAAFREGKEELGLEVSNIEHAFRVSTQIISGFDDTYNLALFAAKVRDAKAFKQPDYETGKRAWMTAKDFVKRGRQTHLALVQKTEQIILTAGGQKEVS